MRQGSDSSKIFNILPDKKSIAVAVRGSMYVTLHPEGRAFATPSGFQSGLDSIVAGAV